MGILRYAKGPNERAAINGAIQRAFERLRGEEGSRARILNVADDVLSRESIARGLDRAGYDVTSVSNGREALQAFQQQEFDLVLTDIFMPERDGLETISALRSRSDDVKIIAISSRSGSDGYLRAARAFGATATLAHPFDMRQLSDAIRRTLSPDRTD